ncbi:MAG: class I SAM-dependent methyltransferase [Burkholderiaceae bacterium]
MDRNKSQQFMLKVVGDVGTAMIANLVLVGDRVGLFRSMAGAGPITSDALAERAGIAPRYVEEWLGAMVSADYVEFDPQGQTYLLPVEHALFFANRDTEYYLGGLFGGLPLVSAAVPRVIEAFEQGRGIAFADFGAELPQALEAMNRPVYERRLVDVWLATMPEVVERLRAGGRAMDIGTGTGIVPILLAKAFPQAWVGGLDIDARSIEIARAQAAQAGVGDRVHLQCAGVDEMQADAPFDFVSTFDCVHDLPDPLGALRRIRDRLADGGVYLMVEPKVSDRLEENRNPFGRMLYGISCLHCVPQALAQGGPGLGACWGPARARALANEAGFSRFDLLPIRSPAQAFYALRA